MAISRRAFGVGLLAASAAGTGGYVYLRQHPEIAGKFGRSLSWGNRKLDLIRSIWEAAANPGN